MLGPKFPPGPLDIRPFNLRQPPKLIPSDPSAGTGMEISHKINSRASAFMASRQEIRSIRLAGCGLVGMRMFTSTRISSGMRWRRKVVDAIELTPDLDQFGNITPGRDDELRHAVLLEYRTILVGALILS